MREKARGRDKARRPDLVVHFKKRVFDEWPLQNGERVRMNTGYAAGLDLVHVRRWKEALGRAGLTWLPAPCGDEGGR
jgi:hypothetical protein